MNADGSEQLKLTPDQGGDSDPGLVARRRQIAFVRRPRIYVMNADGSGRRRLARYAATRLRSCLVTGRAEDRLRQRRDGPFGVSNPEIYVMNVDGSGQRNLTAQPRARQRPCLVAGRAEDRLRAQLRDLRHERRRQRANEPNPQPAHDFAPPGHPTGRGSSSSAGSHDDSTAIATGAVERRSRGPRDERRRQRAAKADAKTAQSRSRWPDRREARVPEGASQIDFVSGRAVEPTSTS